MSNHRKPMNGSNILGNPNLALTISAKDEGTGEHRLVAVSDATPWKTIIGNPPSQIPACYAHAHSDHEGFVNATYACVTDQGATVFLCNGHANGPWTGPYALALVSKELIRYKI